MQKELSTPLHEMEIYVMFVFKYFNDMSQRLTAQRKVPINQSINQSALIRINKYIQPELLTIKLGNKLFMLPRLIFIT